jgi:hypothetical protein
LIGLSVTVRTFSITCRAIAGVACASKTAQLLSDIGCHEIFLDLPVHTSCNAAFYLIERIALSFQSIIGQFELAPAKKIEADR